MSVIATLLEAARPQDLIKSDAFWQSWQRGDDLDGPISLSGVRVTRESAVQLSAVWACVRLLSDTISTLPVGTFQRESGARIPTDRPRWLDSPNSEQTRIELVEQQMGSLLLDGTAFVMTPRDRLGQVTELWNVDPLKVTIRRERNRVVYDVVDDVGRVETLNRSQMFHIAAFAWPGQMRGVSPIEHARRVIGLGLASQEFAERFYGQGMNQGGVVEHPTELTTEQARELKADFARKNSGLRNSHLPAVLTAGAKWREMTVSPEQAQFLETRKFSVEEIARWFRVPPHLISSVERSTSWGTGIEEQNIGFVVYGIRHWLERIEQGWTKHLLTTPGEFVKFNVDGLLRGDQKSRFEALAIGRQWGWYSQNDIRRILDEPPIDGGDDYLTPTTHTTRPDGSATTEFEQGADDGSP